MRTHSLRRSLCPAAFLLVIGLGAGCSAQDRQALQQSRNEAAATLAQDRAEQTKLQKLITTLPTNDPARARIETQLSRLDALGVQIQAYLDQLDRAMKSTGTGAIDPAVQQAIAAIPYGSLALALVAVIFGVVKHLQAGSVGDERQQLQRAFDQVVGAMDAALPSPTAQQKAAIEGVLDTDVKARIAARRI